MCICNTMCIAMVFFSDRPTNKIGFCAYYPDGDIDWRRTCFAKRTEIYSSLHPTIALRTSTIHLRQGARAQVPCDPATPGPLYCWHYRCKTLSRHEGFPCVPCEPTFRDIINVPRLTAYVTTLLLTITHSSLCCFVHWNKYHSSASVPLWGLTFYLL